MATLLQCFNFSLKDSDNHIDFEITNAKRYPEKEQRIL